MIRVFLILAAVLCLLTTCCDDCEDCPVCPEPETEEHLFYIAPKEGHFVKIFSVEQEAFIDSIYIDSAAINQPSQRLVIHIIGDDSLLAVSAGTRTYIVDLKTKEITDSFRASAPVFSRNSRYYFYYNSIDDENRRYELYLYPEHTLIFSDPNAHGFSNFCNQSEIMTYQYYVTQGEPIELGRYNVLGGSADHVAMTWHGNRVTFFVSQAVGSLRKTFIDAATYSFFGVCDFDSDTLRQLKSFSAFGTTALAVSPDEKYVYFTDYGPKQLWYTPSGHIFVWNTETEDSVAAIPNQGIDMFNMLVVSSDSKYILARPYNILNEYTTFSIIDAKEFRVIGIYDLGSLIGNVTAKYCSRTSLFY
jgi:hypothetical protein